MPGALGFVDSLAEDDRRAIVQACTRRKFRAGDTLFHEGDPGDSLHLLVKGHVAIRVTAPLGETVTLTVLGPGANFGEQALLSDSERRTASAVALDAVETMALHRHDFEALRASNPKVDRLLILVLASQVRRLSAQMVDALHASAETRVARRLRDLVEIYRVGDGPVEIPITQEDLASMSGATRPTVNRALQELVAAGVAALSRGRIQITDPARLADMARRGMTRLTRWAVGAGISLLGIAIALAVIHSSLLSVVQFRWEDALQPGLGTRTDVVVVAIDRDSIQAFDDGWPWPRTRHADLLNAIAEGHPRAIAVDLLFTDPRAGDDVLASALAGGPTVLASALGLRIAPGALPQIVDRVEPVDELAASASEVGHANVVVTDAGVVRRVPLVATTDRGVLRPSISLAAIAVADGSAAVITEQADGVQVGARFVPLDDGLLEVNFSDALTASSAVSAIDVMRGEVDPSVFAGKIVVVGATEPTLGDVHAVPVDRVGNTAGVFVVANAVNTIATAGYLSDAPIRWQDVLAIVVIVAAVVAMMRLRLSIALLVALALAAGVVLFAAFRFHTEGEHWNVVGPVSGLAVAVMAGAGWRYVVEIRHRRRAWRLFASYVPPAVVAQLEDASTLEAAVVGARMTVTVLFCDLRGFTPMAAALEPAEVRSVLDHYYAATVAEIHRRGGTVVQFVGDEVFALWGAPVPDDRQCTRAVECALALQAGTADLNAQLATHGLPPVAYGIGLHHGSVVAAHMGTPERRQYGVVGDTVNVGSRLCGQALRGEVVVSEAVASELPDELRAALGAQEAVVVKGVADPLAVRRSVAKAGV